MTTSDVLALSLALSVTTAGGGWMIASWLDGQLDDLAVRERAWGAALLTATLPSLLLVALFLVPSAPTAAPSPPIAELLVTAGLANAPPSGTLRFPLAKLALAIIGLAAVVRLVLFSRRLLRLLRLAATCVEAPAPLTAAAVGQAAEMGLRCPPVLISSATNEAMIVGLLRPRLVLPADMDAAADATTLILRHELTHLKRRDHWALWAEEFLLVLYAFNPWVHAIRHRFAAVREEACDAAALRGAGDACRRLYASTLLAAFRTTANPGPTLAITFTHRRRLAVRRMKLILDPARPVARSARIATAAAGLAAILLTSSSAVALNGLSRAWERDAGPRPTPTEVVLPAITPPLDVAGEPSRSARTDRSGPKPAMSPEPPVAAETPTIPAQESTNPSWRNHPMPQYPQQALAAGVGQASVVLSCEPSAGGSPQDCVVVSEEPSGLGFGQAAIDAAEQAQLVVREGGETPARVQFTVRFRMSQ